MQDEGGSEFNFTQEQIDGMVLRWCDLMQLKHTTLTPGPDSIFALDLVISDMNKRLLLNNSAFVPYMCVAPCLSQSSRARHIAA